MQVWLDIVWHHFIVIQLWYKYWWEVFQIPYLHKAPALCVIVTSIPFMGQTDNCIIFFAQATH